MIFVYYVVGLICLFDCLLLYLLVVWLCLVGFVGFALFVVVVLSLDLFADGIGGFGFVRLLFLFGFDLVLNAWLCCVFRLLGVGWVFLVSWIFVDVVARLGGW